MDIPDNLLTDVLEPLEDEISCKFGSQCYSSTNTCPFSANPATPTTLKTASSSPTLMAANSLSAASSALPNIGSSLKDMLSLIANIASGAKDTKGYEESDSKSKELTGIGNS